MYISDILDNPDFVFSGYCKIQELHPDGTRKKIWSNAKSGDMEPGLFFSLSSLKVFSLKVDKKGFLVVSYLARPAEQFEHEYEVKWLETLTAYDNHDALQPMTASDARICLMEWKKSGVKDIPIAFTVPESGCELLAYLWNAFIVNE